MERMDYFLFKTEPDVYSFDNFLSDKETVWDGVTNPTAVKYLREMKAGTKWIFYHTGDERLARTPGSADGGIVPLGSPSATTCASQYVVLSMIEWKYMNGSWRVA